MAYGDSYSAVQAADLSERNASLDRGQRSLSMLLGVLQNRKANAIEEEKLQQNADIAQQHLAQSQEQLDWQKALTQKGLQADAAKLDFEHAKQAFVEKHAAQLLLMDQGRQALEERKIKAMEGNNPTTERRNEFLFKQAVDDADNGKFRDEEEVGQAYPNLDPTQRGAIARRSQVAYEQKANVYGYADKVAKVLNHYDELDQKIKVEDDKHYFERAKNSDYKNWVKERASLGEHVAKIKGNKNFQNIVVFDGDAGKYIPVMTDPGSRAARAQAGSDTEANVGREDFSSAVTPPVAATTTTANVQAQDPRIPIYKQLVDSGVPEDQAVGEADRRYREMRQANTALINPLLYGGAVGY
jgi:hypothetical protein